LSRKIEELPQKIIIETVIEFPQLMRKDIWNWVGGFFPFNAYYYVDGLYVGFF
jgi:hypothetical protein